MPTVDTSVADEDKAGSPPSQTGLPSWVKTKKQMQKVYISRVRGCSNKCKVNNTDSRGTA